MTTTTASGLLWLSELVEEHTKLSKVIGKKCIYVREIDRTCPRIRRLPRVQGAFSTDVDGFALPQAIILLHILLAFTDALPAHKIAFSILCHIIYLQNFSDAWPLVSLSSQSFIASCVLVVADHFLWFFHFSHLTHRAQHAAHHAYRGGPVVRPPAFGEMATFFAICVWLTPLFLFLSLSANDNTLPTSGESRGLRSFLPSPRFL
jgi:synaptojanin